jgi:hypothetical protein
MMGLNLQIFTILTITMLFSLSERAYSGVVKRKTIKVAQANTQIRETQVMRISMPQKAPEKRPDRRPIRETGRRTRQRRIPL